MLIERDYSEVKKGANKVQCMHILPCVSNQMSIRSSLLTIQPKSISYADLILDQSNGILVRPLSLLSCDVGLKTLVNTANALSLQYEKCWVVLYAQAELR